MNTNTTDDLAEREQSVQFAAPLSGSLFSLEEEGGGLMVPEITYKWRVLQHIGRWDAEQ